MIIISVSGTPGTGKTFLSKEVARHFGFKYFNLGSFIRKNGLYECVDKDRGCLIVDPLKLNKAIKAYLKESPKLKGVVFDSLLAHLVNPGTNTIIPIIVKCPLPILKNRLEKRRYSAAKVRENLDSEIFDVCLTESLERGINPLVLDGSKSPKSNIKRIISVIASSIRHKHV